MQKLTEDLSSHSELQGTKQSKFPYLTQTNDKKN